MQHTPFTAKDAAAPGDTIPPEGEAVPALPVLRFGIKSRILGDASGAAMEPLDADWPASAREALLQLRQHRCHFCGLLAANHQIHNLNGNHCDLRQDNLVAACALCHAWRHLDDLLPGMVGVAYLPGLTAQDVNHLQRTIAIAIHSGDAALADDARALLAWLHGRRAPVRAAWGSDDPAVFGAALRRLPEHLRANVDLAFNGLALVFDVSFCDALVPGWTSGPYACPPTDEWPSICHETLRAGASPS